MKTDRKTILIADDVRSIRELVQSTLAGSGYRILEAVDGDAAWRLLHDEQPDLALLAISMPGRNGLELTWAIRADERLRAMKVVLMTGFLSELVRDEGDLAGADSYLTKPFSPLALRRVIAEALEL